MDLAKSYNKLLQSDDYRYFERNLRIAKGQSTKVFYSDIVKRVKLEFMGAVDDGGNIQSYNWNKAEKCFNISNAKFENLIVGNNILQDVAKIYSEMASDKKPIVETNNEEFMEQFSLDTKTGELVFTSSYSGSTLLKGVVNQENGTFSMYSIKRKDFFEVYDEFNPELVKAFVVFAKIGEEDSLLKCEIYSEGKTEYRLYAINDDNWQEQQYDSDLSEFGLRADGLGYINEYEGWQVAYISGYSAYNDDLVSNVREMVIQDTTTSQAFNKCLNPLTQVPESMIEYDERGIGKVHIEDRVVIVRQGDIEVKQIQMNTNVAEWNIQRENILQNIYVSTGTNENILGITKNGSSVSSGTSIERSMQRILSVVNYKRNKVYEALEQVIKWGYAELKGSELDLVIKGDDILNKTSKEVLEEKGLELDNLGKLADTYGKLVQITTDSEIQNLAIQLGDNLKEKLKELGFGR